MAYYGAIEAFNQANALRNQSDMQGVQMLGALGNLEKDNIQMNALRQQAADDAALRQVYQQTGGDPAKVRQALVQQGLHKQVQAFDTQDLAKRKGEADIAKDTAEATLKQSTFLRDAMAPINDQAGYDQFRADPRVTAALGGRQLPAQFDPKFKESFVMKADDYLSRSTPKFERVDIGGKIVTIDTNPFTNPAIKGTQFDKTNTPDAILTDQRARAEGAANRGVTMRGQDMTDARTREQQAAGRWTNDLERGIQVNMQTGETRPITQNAQPIGEKPKDLTDSQAKAQLFATRMQNSNKILSDLAEKGTTTSVPGATAGYGVGSAINVVSPANQQMLVQAKRDFVNAVLRRESGAVISPSEFENADKQYFPQVGDSKQVIAQKAANRQTAIDGIMAEVPARKRMAPAGNTGGATGSFGTSDIHAQADAILKGK